MNFWYESSPLFRSMMLVVLVLVVVKSAVAVIYLKHREVQLYITLQGLQQQYEQELEEMGRLRLEEAAWGNLARIEDHARGKLQMSYPAAAQRVVIH
ncbi:MAG: cell division protein FtsL [Gammaproteobacteria bacterium]|jgi:cell division protein FtsL|nr:cell division protein FtsL [Gammaproteobacteria bacterium]